MNRNGLRVGVVGVGVMGSAIATRLLERGHRLWLRDADPAKTGPLVASGAVAAPSAAALAAEVDYIVTSLNTAEIVERVVFGPEGIAAGAAPGKLLIDMSSIDPQATAVMAARLEAETGMAWVDAPLSGGAPAAREGRLTLMLGGSAAAVERARAVLGELAANITHMGGNGAGQTTKLINQVLCACNFLAVAEATRLALDGKVDARKVPSALAGGRANSRILQEFMPKMAAFDYTPTGRIDNMLKDLEAVQRYAMALRTPMPLTGLVTELHRIMVAAGIGPEDSAAYMKLFDFGRGASAAADDGRVARRRGRDGRVRLRQVHDRPGHRHGPAAFPSSRATRSTPPPTSPRWRPASRSTTPIAGPGSTGWARRSATLRASRVARSPPARPSSVSTATACAPPPPCRCASSASSARAS